jgi:hypothetical protein
MNKISIPKKSIIISQYFAIGRLGNYLYNIALCTKILFELNITYPDYKKYMYFYCERNVKDGHGNSNAYNYYENDENSYHLSVFKYDQVDKNDNIYSITTNFNNILFENPNNITNEMLMQLNTEERLLWSRDADSYEVIFDDFPIIIEVLKYNDIVYIYINNCTYESINNINPLYKNLYPINNDISTPIIDKLNKILNKYEKITYIFIKFNFIIIGTHITFHSQNFNNYFSKKIFNSNSQILVKNIYDRACDRAKKSKLSKSSFISLHFRGSDYGDPNKDASEFIVLSPQYYIDCINDICNKTQDRLYFVFFCSPEDNKYILETYIPYINQNINHTNVKLLFYEEFLGDDNRLINGQLNIYLMGLFDYMCLSNSTYSWWSHYFSKNYYNKNKTFVSLLWKYPCDINKYTNYNQQLVTNNVVINTNNYLLNSLTFYGYSSSMFTASLFKKFMGQIIVNLLQIKLDAKMFKFYCNTILTFYKKYLVTNTYVKTINTLIEITKLYEKGDTNFKLKLQNLLKVLYGELFSVNMHPFLLENNNDMDERYIFIKIDKLMLSYDRIKDTSMFYKNNEIKKSVININCIDDTTFLQIKSCKNSHS